ncbi:MAG: penicillin-binding protein 2 [Bdellovibrionota bacterium]|nr:MAG: penicillin-binding protein 2 [Bdellovibrionota bacterium]
MRQCCSHNGTRRTRLGLAHANPVNRRIRVMVFGALCAVWIVVLVARLASLQLIEESQWLHRSARQHSTELTIASARGTIYDRENRMLAVSVPASSVYVRPHQVSDKEATAEILSKLLSIPRDEIRAKLDSDKPFVWIARQIPRLHGEKVAAQAIRGVDTMMESRRFYPYNHAASTLIGKVGVDGNGLSGIERRYESQLHGQHRRDKVKRDALGNLLFDDDPLKIMEIPQGSSVQLTIDAMVQTVLQEELERGRKSANAKAAMGVMVDAYSGQILALGHSPSVNLNLPARHSKADLAEPVLESVFEPGSVMKPFVAAAALQEGLVRPTDLVDCESGRMSFGGHIVKDVHPIKTVSVYDVVVRSSNIGMAKIGSRLGPQRLHEYLQRFGFGRNSQLGLPGETAGILRPVSEWARVDLATHSFGHGMAVTPLQVVRAFSSLVNGGSLPRLTVVHSGGSEDSTVTPFLRQDVVSQVRKMLIGAVHDEHGTGKNAKIPGVIVGGKTGTAQVPRKEGGGYEPGAYIASFVGFAEVPESELPILPVLMVSIIEPNTTSIYGGTLAAPVFQRVMQRVLNHFGAHTDWGGPNHNEAQPRGDQLIAPRNPVPIVPASFRM